MKVHALQRPNVKSIRWEDTPGHVAGEELGRVSQGLYVLLFENGRDYDIRDNNTKPKIVVQRRGSSLKAGKFEKTLLTRLANYNDHLRREDDGKYAFLECYRGGYVLDLTEVATPLPAARIFERYWVEGVHRYLEDRGLLAADVKPKKRSEWRSVRAGAWDAAVEQDLVAYLGLLAANIASMARFATVPAR